MTDARRNRHGVPILSSLPRETCSTRGCPRVVNQYEDTGLCDDHAERVYEAVQVVRNAEAERRRAAPLTAKDHITNFFEKISEDAAAAEAAEEAAEAAAKREVIYYVKNGGHIKIGWTSNLTKRMRAYPPGCELMAVHDGDRVDERKLHQRFAVHRSHGREWYPLAPVILDHIKRVVAEHGVPEVVEFGAKATEVPRPHSNKEFSKRKGWRRIA